MIPRWLSIKTVDFFMLKTFLWAFIAAFTLFAVIGFVIVVFSELDDMLGKGVTFGVGFTYILLCLPHEIVRATPIVVVLAVIMGIGGLVRDREILMLYVAGYSPVRLSYSLIVAMCGIIFMMYLFNEYVSAPFAEHAKLLRETRIKQQSDGLVSTTGFWLYGKGDRIYRAKRFVPPNKIEGLTIFEFQGPNKTISARLNAETGLYDPKKGWMLKNVTAHHIREDGEIKREGPYDQEYFFEYAPEDFTQLLVHPEQMSHRELKSIVDSIRNAGEDPVTYLPDLRIHEAFPFAILFLGMMSYSMVLKLTPVLGLRASVSA